MRWRRSQHPAAMLAMQHTAQQGTRATRVPSRALTESILHTKERTLTHSHVARVLTHQPCVCLKQIVAVPQMDSSGGIFTPSISLHKRGELRSATTTLAPVCFRVDPTPTHARLRRKNPSPSPYKPGISSVSVQARGCDAGAAGGARRPQLLLAWYGMVWHGWLSHWHSTLGHAATRKVCS